MDPETLKKISKTLVTTQQNKASKELNMSGAINDALKKVAGVGQVAVNFGKGVQDISTDLVQGAYRSAASIGTEGARLVTGQKYNPESATKLEKAFAREFYGQEDLPSFQSEGESLLDVFGASDKTKKNLGYATGFGLALLDVPTGGKGSGALKYAPKLVKSIAKAISATDDEAAIAKILEDGTQRLDPAVVSTLSKEFSSVTDSTAIRRKIVETLKNSTASATNYTPRQVTNQLKIVDNIGVKELERAGTKVTQEMQVLYDQISAAKQYAQSADVTPAAANKLLAEARDAADKLVSISRASVKSTDDAIGEALEQVANLRSTTPRTSALPGFKSLDNGRVALDESGIVVSQTPKIVGDIGKTTSRTEVLRRAAEGMLPPTPSKETIVEQLGDFNAICENCVTVARETLESDPGSVPVRGIFASNADEAAKRWLDNIGSGRSTALDGFDHIGVKTGTGEMIDNAPALPKGATFFSEDDIRAVMDASKKERGFITTVKESPRTNPEVAEQVRSMYNPITNKETLDEAVQILAQGDDEALSFVKNADAPTAKTNAVAQLLIEKFQREGRVAAAVDLVETVAKQTTSQAQAIQILSLWNRLTPAGILRYADKELKAAGKTLTPELADELVASSKRIKTMEDGWEKSFETSKMMKSISDQLPVSRLRQISTIQTMLLLLNPKTWLRNIIGNSGFGALENVSDIPAAMLDSAVSLITGQRTTVLPSILAQSKGAVRGATEGWKEALAGVNTLQTKTQFDIPQTPAFQKGVGKALETLLSVELRVPDRMFYQSAYDGSIYKQMKAANLSRAKNGAEPIVEPTEGMMEIAVHDALYRTFQDDSAIAKTLTGLKRVLNGGKEFGLGDVLIKFPRTPGNLLSRGIDYSPAGFVNVLYQAARPLMGKTFNQKEFVEAFGRAITGSGTLVGTGLLMNQLGLLTAKADDNPDVAASKRAQGLGDYKINVSGLKRFVLSGMDPAQAKLQKGDTLVTYDWFQPAAIPIAIGANIGENKGIKADSFLGETFDAVLNGANTIVDQPVLQNLRKFAEDASYQGVFGALGKQLATLPASFVPTLLNQVRQLIDNDSRNTYSKDTFEYAVNLVKDRIPGLSQTLPQRITPFGEEQERYQGGTNNVFNVLFNPLFATKYKDDPAVTMALDLFEQTGDSAVVPDTKRYKQTINGEEIQLGPKTYEKFQRFVGSRTRTYLNSIAQDPEFRKLEPEKRADYIAQVLRDIHAYGKIVVLGDRPKSPNRRVMTMYEQEYGQ